jgi:hypothetical protein
MVQAVASLTRAIDRLLSSATIGSFSGLKVTTEDTTSSTFLLKSSLRGTMVSYAALPRSGANSSQVLRLLLLGTRSKSAWQISQ